MLPIVSFAHSTTVASSCVWHSSPPACRSRFACLSSLNIVILHCCPLSRFHCPFCILHGPRSRFDLRFHPISVRSRQLKSCSTVWFSQLLSSANHRSPRNAVVVEVDACIASRGVSPRDFAKVQSRHPSPLPIVINAVTLVWLRQLYCACVFFHDAQSASVISLNFHCIAALFACASLVESLFSFCARLKSSRLSLARQVSLVSYDVTCAIATSSTTFWT